MSKLYRLVGVGNAELVAGLSELVRQSNALTARVLAHLVEIDERRLHLELGFSSLFAYCVEGLGMSEGTAGRRVTAARVCRRFPEAFERVARAELHLCALCALAPHLSEHNAAELFEASKGKTRRQVEELLAVRFPRPDVREQIRRLPARGPALAARVATVNGANGAVEQTLSPSRGFDALCDTRDSRGSLEVDEPKGESRATAVRSEAPVIAADSTPRRIEHAVTDDGPRRPRACELEPLSVGRFGVHFTADAELRDLLERARALASHRVPKGDLAGLMKLMVASFVQQEEKRRFGIGKKLRRGDSKARHTEGSELTDPPGGTSISSCASQTPTPPARPKPPGGGAHSRYLSVQVRREIHARDGGQCTFVSLDGRRCNARAFIQFDHLRPFAWRGSSDALNLRLLCKAHNLLHARKCFGALHLAAKIAARSRDRSGQLPKVTGG